MQVDRLLLDAPAQPAASNRPFPMRGRAALPAGTAVTVEADRGAGFAPAATTTVQPDGTFVAAVVPGTTATYRAVAGPDASPPVSLLVLDRRVAIRARRARRGLVDLGERLARLGRRARRPPALPPRALRLVAGAAGEARPLVGGALRVADAAAGSRSASCSRFRTARRPWRSAGRSGSGRRAEPRPVRGAGYISGEGGIRVSPVTSGMRIATSSTKHQRPVLARLERADDRVLGCARRARSRAGWASRRSSRRGRTPGRCAGAATAAGGQAVLAAVDGLGQLGDLDVVEVGAGRHGRPLGQGRVKGSETWKVVRPGSESNGERAVVAVDDDPPRGGEAEAGALRRRPWW